MKYRCYMVVLNETGGVIFEYRFSDFNLNGLPALVKSFVNKAGYSMKVEIVAYTP